MMNRKKFIENLEDAYDFVFNDTVLTVGSFIFNLFTAAASLFYALTGALPIIPQYAWGGIFVFMLIAGTNSARDIIDLEDEPEDDDEDDDEDEEIVEG